MQGVVRSQFLEIDLSDEDVWISLAVGVDIHGIGFLSGQGRIAPEAGGAEAEFARGGGEGEMDGVHTELM